MVDSRTTYTKHIISGIRWANNEIKDMRKLYIVKNMSSEETARHLNEKYWKGENVRTWRAIEHKARTSGMKKREHSKYAYGRITPVHNKIWQLYKNNVKLDEISKLCSIPLGTVKSAIHYMKNCTMMNQVKLIDSKLSKDEIADVKTKQELINNIQDLERQLTRAKATTSVIVDAISTVVKDLPPIKVPTFIIKKGMHKPETAMLELGDIHVGEKVLKQDVANVAEYDFDKFIKRMEILRDGIIECIDIQRSKIPIDTLDINMLGDIVTGEDIYLGQNRNIDMELTKQTFEGAHALSELLLSPMCAYFKKVRVRAVWGNHGRGWGRPGQVHPRTNFDYIVYRFLNEQYKNQSNIEFYIAECPLMLYILPEAPKYTHLISHGDEVGRWMSIPFYGIQRDMGRYVQLFNTNIHYWHMGHHHSAAKIDMPYGEQIVNGTFVEGTELSVLKMKTKSRPKQLLYGFNNSRGITWRYDIQLSPMVNMVQDSDGIFTPTFKRK